MSENTLPVAYESFMSTARRWLNDHGREHEERVTAPTQRVIPCPAHEDGVASLSVGWGDEKKKVILECHAGCDWREVLTALDLDEADLMEPKPLRKPRGKRETEYVYTDEDAQPILRAVRWNPKRFTQEYVNEAGRWVSGANGHRHLLYQLPDIAEEVAHPSAGVIHIAEGERDVDNIRKLDRIATCNLGGAGKWDDSISEHFKGYTGVVRIIVDHDMKAPFAGQKHALEVQRSLREVAGIEAAMFYAAAGKDFSDHVASGHNLDALVPVTPDELLVEIGSAKESNQVALRPLTEYGNAERFTARRGDVCRYVPSLGKWTVWNETRWVVDDDGQVDRWVKETARAIPAEAALVADKEKRSAILRWAADSESRGRLTSTKLLAQTEPGMSIELKAFDADPNILNVINGVIDLRDGTRRDHRREDFLRRMAPVVFDPEARSEEFEAFLQRVIPETEERAFLQRAAGYSATGLTSEHKFLMLYSNGRSGKTTLGEIILAVLGEDDVLGYGTTLRPEALMASKFDNIPTEIADLADVRYVLTSEFPEGMRLNEPLIKRLTGGDTNKARFMRQDSFSFKPKCTIWATTNHRPVVHGTDEGIWARHLLSAGWAFIPEEERDTKLPDRLRAEALPAILNWIVAGAVEWYEQGLNPPESVLAATRLYREESDIMGDFLDEECEVGSDEQVSKQRVYDRYVEWCRAGGLHPITKIALGRMLKQHLGDNITDIGSDGAKLRVGKAKVHVWRGLSVTEPPQILTFSQENVTPLLAAQNAPEKRAAKRPSRRSGGTR